MKYLILVLVVGIVLLAMSARGRRGADDGARSGGDAARGRRKAAPMLACAHCGVHLPREDAVLDAGGRAYCSQAHRLAGPR